MDLMQIRRQMMGVIASQSGGGLPVGYTQIEWLKGTGSQYIDTGIIPTLQTSAVCEYSLGENYSGDQIMFGCESNDGNFNAELYAVRSWYSSAGTSKYRNVLTNYGKSLDTKHIVELSGERFAVDGTTASSNATQTAVPSRSVYIFAWHNKSNLPQYYTTTTRIHSLKLYENSVLSHDFVPCVRISDNEPGLYDIIGNQFYANAGTGTFVIPT